MIFIDFETTSDKPIEHGAVAYTSSKGFRPLMVAYSLGEDEPTHIWDFETFTWDGVSKTSNIHYPITGKYPIPNDLFVALISTNERIIAHNADFEYNVLEAIGFNLDVSRFYCTRVAAAYLSLPQSLGELARVLGCKSQKKKGKDERKAMNLFSINGKPYTEDLLLWELYKDYCRFDVLTLKDCYANMQSIPSDELKAYHMNMGYNHRGVRVDVDRAKDVLSKYELAKETIQNYGFRKFGFDIKNKNAVKKYLGLDSLLKERVEELLKTDKTLEDSDIEILELNMLLGQSSIAKLNFIVEANVNGRIYDSLKFYGAQRTGRWSSKGLQLQNLPNLSVPDLEDFYIKTQKKDLEDVGKAREFMEKAPAFVRSCLLPNEGKQLISLDFSSIEARVLSWLAGSTERLDIFRGDGKIYEHTASKLFGIPVEKVTKNSKERKIGKAGELAFGYEGGVAAFDRFGKGELALMSQSEKKEIVYKWRKANPEIVAFWRGVEKAFISAFYNGESTFRCLKFRKIGSSVGIRLPSGRWLVYREVHHSEANGLTEIRYDGSPIKSWEFKEFLEKQGIENVVTPEFLFDLPIRDKIPFRKGMELVVQKSKSQLKFISFDEDGNEQEEFKVTNLVFEEDATYYSKKDLFNPPAERYSRTGIYGGLITENITQAIARDLIVKAINDFEASDLEFDMHFFVHDEINGSGLCNTPELEERFKYYMSSDSYSDDFWGKDIPVATSLDVLDRYKK